MPRPGRGSFSGRTEQLAAGVTLFPAQRTSWLRQRTFGWPSESLARGKGLFLAQVTLWLREEVCSAFPAGTDRRNRSFPAAGGRYLEQGR